MSQKADTLYIDSVVRSQFNRLQTQLQRVQAEVSQRGNFLSPELVKQLESNVGGNALPLELLKTMESRIQQLERTQQVHQSTQHTLSESSELAQVGLSELNAKISMLENEILSLQSEVTRNDQVGDETRRKFKSLQSRTSTLHVDLDAMH